jgi:outer membrane protein OmpA-like peptidoglycan-associated protein
VRITDIRLNWQGDSLQINFNLGVNPKAVKRGHALLLTPVIADADNTVELKPLLLQREEIEPFMPYRQTIAYQPWMQGSDIRMNALSFDCCEVVDFPVGTVARRILTNPSTSRPAPAVQAPTVQAPPATTPQRPVTVSPRRDVPAYAVPVENDRIPQTETEIRTAAIGMNNTSLNIQFRQNETTLDENFRDNRAALNELVNVVTRLENAADSRISYILIDGHVSPEGGAAVNLPIGQQRALAVKRYLERRIGLPPSRIVAHNGYIDWEYLKQMVLDSDMYEKYQVIDIIDNVPEWDARRKIGRLGQIMLLHGGTTYRYMLREFFPKMRNATYIKVFYQDRR